MSEIRRVAALGSSFAAGPIIDPVVDAGAGRSARNYPHLLAEILGAELVDRTVSGATTASILDVPQVTMTGEVFAPQIEGLPSDADLVTITAGGNDLRFISSLLYTAWRRVEPTGPHAGFFEQEFPHGITVPTPREVDGAASGLARIVAEVRSRAPKARVVLVDYLTVLSPDVEASDDAPFDDESIGDLLQIQSTVVRAFELAAERSGAELVRVSAASSGHGLGTPEPWVFGLQRSMERVGGSFHPNEEGMRAVAELIAAHLARHPQQPAN